MMSTHFHLAGVVKIEFVSQIVGETRGSVGGWEK